MTVFLWWLVGSCSFAGFVMLMEKRLTLGVLIASIPMGFFGLIIPIIIFLVTLVSVIVEYSDIEIWRKK